MALVLLPWLAPVALADAPLVTSVSPMAAAPGKTVDVMLRGSSLDRPTAFWASFPATATFADAAGDHVTCRITVPAGATVGLGAIRVATRGGTSNLVPFMVDDLATAHTGSEGAGTAAATSVSMLAAVEGVCRPLASNVYRFAAKQGRRVSVEVVAARLGSALDPVIRLLDPAGREVAWADDSPGAGADGRFAHVCESDGDYRIEVRDVGYEGGPAYRYRLRVGDFPLAAVPFPLGGRRGSTGMYTLLGEGCDALPPALLTLPADRSRANVSACQPGGAGSGYAAVVVGDVDETIEAEPNDTPESATPLAIPVAVSGRLGVAGDVDFYRVVAKKGERISVRSRTRSLGSPCDLALRWVRKDGSVLAESKSDMPGEAVVDVTPAEDGTLWLRVSEISGAGGAALAYRLEVERARPGFALGIDTDKADAPAGATLDLKVTCARRDYGGPVALSVEGITPASVEGATIPAGKQEATLKVKLPPDLPAGSIAHLRIIGTASAGGEEARVVASTAAALRKLYPKLLYPPDDLDGDIAVGIRENAH